MARRSSRVARSRVNTKCLSFHHLEQRYVLDVTFGVAFGNDFNALLDAAVEDALYPQDLFTADQRITIRSQILVTLADAFHGWPITFDDTPDELFTGAKISFSETTAEADFYQTHHALPDVFNQLSSPQSGYHDDDVKVFTANFWQVMLNVADSDVRARRVAAALGSAAVQGVAKNLGLSVYTSYFYPTIDPESTAGLQNADWMAIPDDPETDQVVEGTGQSPAQFGSFYKRFSPMGQAILSYANNVGYNSGSIVTDVGANFDDDDDDFNDGAYPVEWNDEGTAAFEVATNSLTRWYKFYAFQGQRVSIGVMSQKDQKTATDEKVTDVQVKLWANDPDMEEAALASSLNSGVSDDSFGSGNFETSDAWLLNAEVPEDGWYYVEVPNGTGAKQYKMVMMLEGAYIEDGILKMFGAPGAFRDSIDLEEEDGNYYVTINGREQGPFPALWVEGLLFETFGGNDRAVMPKNLDLPSLFIMGAENDFVSGGEGIDIIYLGDGCDEAWGWDGHDAIHGGAGDDILFGYGYIMGILEPSEEGEVSGGTGWDLIDGDPFADWNNEEPCDPVGFTDLSVVSFESDGNQLRVDFEDESLCCRRVNIELWAMSTGEEQPYLLSTAANLFAIPLNAEGLYRVIFTPAFSDVAYDYALSAVVHPLAGAIDTNLSNNDIVFSGGLFLTTGKVLHFQGTGTSDTITVVEDGGVYEVTVNSVLYEYDVADVDAFRVRTHGGGDVLDGHLVDLLFAGWGGGGNDTLLGGSQNDAFYGGADTDFLAGYGGADILAGEGSGDYLLGGDGNDFLYGGEGNDYCYGQGGDDYVEGNDGDDSLSGDDGVDLLHGNDGNDMITGGSGADTIHGGDGNDTLLGAAGNDTIYCGAGYDTGYGDYYYFTSSSEGGNDALYGEADADYLWGGYGNDTLEGGAASDVLYGDYWGENTEADGDDTIRGGDGDDVAYGGYGNDSVYGDSGNDYLLGYGGNDRLEGGTGNDTAYGGYGDDTILGGDDDDSLFGDDGDDSLYGDAHADYLVGGYGADLIEGGTGNDIGYGDAAYQDCSSGDADAMTGGDGNDTFYGGYGNDTLDGGAGADVLHGESENDTLSGGSENDLLVGGYGADTLDAGAGDDIGYGDAAYQDCSSGDADAMTGGDGNDTFYGGYGNDTLDGGAGADVLHGEGENDSIAGGDGNDSLDGGYGADLVSGGAGNDTVYGGPNYYGDKGDTLHGDAGADLLVGGYGNDTMTGGDDGDTMFGGQGDDSMEGGDAADTLAGEEGNDTLAGGAGNDVLDGGYGGDSISGGNGDDTITGGQNWSGDEGDTLHGDAGADTMYGGYGNDTMTGGDDADWIDAGYGHDSVSGGGGNDTVYGGPNYYGDEGDTLHGDAGNDTMHGGYGNDYMEGGDGDDTLSGEDGDDSLSGGNNATGYGTGGGDHLFGGTGNDTLNGDDGDDFLWGDGGDDTLNGGNGIDVLVGGDGADTLNGDAGEDILDAGDDEGDVENQ